MAKSKSEAAGEFLSSLCIVAPNSIHRSVALTIYLVPKTASFNNVTLGTKFQHLERIETFKATQHERKKLINLATLKVFCTLKCIIESTFSFGSIKNQLLKNSYHKGQNC